MLRFSQSLAVHLHDERHDFVQFPQRITFMLPVDGGVWVGQRDHVAFLRGAAPGEWTLERKACSAPVPGSAMLAPPDALSGELAEGSTPCALWLSEHGYVAGTASGAVTMPHAGTLQGVTGEVGSSVVFASRVVTAVS